METKILNIEKKEYFSIIDDLGISIVNLTHNDIIVDVEKNIILRKSDYPVYLLFKSSIPRVTAVPQSRKKTFFIVESCVKAALSRPDFCVSVKVVVGEDEDGTNKLVPIFEIGGNK